MAQTMYLLKFAMFQGLKSHKPKFADELVRSNEKGPPSESSTYHTLQKKKRAKVEHVPEKEREEKYVYVFCVTTYRIIIIVCTKNV